MLTKEFIHGLKEFVDRHLSIIEEMKCNYMDMPAYSCEPVLESEIEDFIKNNKNPSFNEILFKHIDKLGVSDSEVYKKAGIDRRHFSKIRSNPDYHPSKNTAIALAIALKLDQKQTDELIGAAGYTLSDSEIFDLVITYCLEKKVYNIFEVNEALDYFSLKPLVGVE